MLKIRCIWAKLKISEKFQDGRWLESVQGCDREGVNNLLALHPNTLSDNKTGNLHP